MAPSRRSRLTIGLAFAWIGLIGGFSLPGYGQSGPVPVPAGSVVQRVPTWVRTGNFNVAERIGASTTLLADGRVLVAGGVDPNLLASAEVFDPATATWTYTYDLLSARLHHTATLLQDGKVLVSGGLGFTIGLLFAVTDSELYDPSTNRWSRAANPIISRLSATATRLASGQVLLVGGIDTSHFQGIADAELYDPSSNTWRLTAKPHNSRRDHTATLLNDGKVLVVGGVTDENYDPDSEFPKPSRAELYDPAANTWTEVGVPINVNGHSAALLADGKVLIAGGESVVGNHFDGLADYLFDPASMAWIAVAKQINFHGQGATLTRLRDGKVLVVGGETYTAGGAELYDPATDSWAVAAQPVDIFRFGHSATLLNSGNVLVAGGNSSVNAEIYLDSFPPADNSFRMTAMFTDQAGLVQQIQFQELFGRNDQQHFAGLTLEVRTRSGVVKTVTFQNDLPESNTAGRYALIGTLNPTPDFLLPQGFIPTDGGTLTFAGIDVWDFPNVPTNGYTVLLRDNTLTTNPPFLTGMIFRAFGGFFTGLSVQIDPVIEYYNKSLDHYFITSSQPDIDALDSRRTPGWSRTGESFPALISIFPAGWPQPDSRPVCRFWIPPAVGDSHFFSVSPVECAAAQGIPGYLLETNQAFFASLPNEQTGACVEQPIPVYRLWNGRFDSNHRYTSSAAIRDVMKAKGYIAEGYGPNAVAMCVGGGVDSGE